MDPIQSQNDARLPTRRTPTEWLRASPIAVIKLGTVWPEVIENIDQELVWTISRNLNVDLLTRRIAMQRETGH